MARWTWNPLNWKLMTYIIKRCDTEILLIFLSQCKHIKTFVYWNIKLYKYIWNLYNEYKILTRWCLQNLLEFENRPKIDNKKGIQCGLGVLYWLVHFLLLFLNCILNRYYLIHHRQHSFQIGHKRKSSPNLIEVG